ncbi:MAG: glutamate racemase [Vulcanimicrobiaceae bacterium]
MLGLFDSGLGGLTVLRRVRDELPDADLVFFADQAHVPYGDRSAEDLERLLRHNLAWFDARGVDAVVMACNTSCAIGQTRGWPESRARVFDLIEAAAIAVERAGFLHIGVVATAATARSGAYGRAIRARVPGAMVTEIAAPELVPLVEAGKTGTGEARDAVARACAQLPRALDAAILACTHYPLLDADFARALGAGVERLDPAVEQAARVARFAHERRMAGETGRTSYVTSGDAARFRDQLVRLGVSALELGDMEHVEEK